LPDKAVDLVDEAASALRMQVDSQPVELDRLQRKIMQLEIEKAALKKEKDEASKERLKSIEKEIAELSEEKNTLEQRWKNEKAVISELQELKSAIENLKTEAEQLERAGDLQKVAEIRYGRIPEMEKRLDELQKKLAKHQKQDRILKEEVTEEDIAAVVSRWTSIPLKKMLQSDLEKLKDAESGLGERVVGQNEAIHAIANALRRSRVGISDEQRPIGSFLFVGPTGVGKTELAKSLAEFMFNDDKALIRIDMSEYMERHAVARLIGSPPGYVGHEEGGQLTEKVRRRPYSVVLLDEIEKAHPEAFNILLQVLDNGRLTDSKGRQVNFKNTIIILTSNVGSGMINKSNIGFGAKGASITNENEAQYTEMKERVMESIKETFKPEFINRLDDIIIFHHLNPEELKEIVDLQLQKLRDRLKEKGVEISLTKDAREHLAGIGYDELYGARPLKRVIQSRILDPLAMKMIEGNIIDGAKVSVDYKQSEFSFQIA